MILWAPQLVLVGKLLLLAPPLVSSTSTVTSTRQLYVSINTTYVTLTQVGNDTVGLTFAVSSLSTSSSPSKPASPTATATITSALHFSPTLPAFLTTPPSPSLVTAIQLAIFSAQSAWTAYSKYEFLREGVYEDAPPDAQTSMAVTGFDWEIIVQQPWYPDVMEYWRNYVEDQARALQEIMDRIVWGEILNGSNNTSGGGNIIKETQGWGMLVGSFMGLVLMIMEML